MANSKFESQSQTQMVVSTLDLLNAVEAEENLTQRKLANRLGVALGLANTLVKRCVRKGLLKVQEVPARRYAYYLTPQGFSEKSKLTAEYLSASLEFFRRARQEYNEVFAHCKSRNWDQIVLCGSGDLAEIASLAAAENGVTLTAIIDPTTNQKMIVDLPVWRDLDLDNGIEIDAAIITHTAHPQQTFDDLLTRFPIDRIIAPPLLRISLPTQKAPMEDALE